MIRDTTRSTTTHKLYPSRPLFRTERIAPESRKPELGRGGRLAGRLSDRLGRARPLCADRAGRVAARSRCGGGRRAGDGRPGQSAGSAGDRGGEQRGETRSDRAALCARCGDCDGGGVSRGGEGADRGEWRRRYLRTGRRGSEESRVGEEGGLTCEYW